MNRTLSIVAVVVLATSAFAQGGRGGGQQGGGFGGQRGGFGMQAQGALLSETILLLRNDVKKEIKVTEEQQKKLDALQVEMRQKMTAQFEAMRNGGNNGGQAGTRGGFDREAIQKMMEESQKESTEKTKAILTAEQWKRLTQIRVQMAGSRLFTEDEFTKKLGLKANQKLDIMDMLDKQSQANQQIMAKMREEGADREALAKDMVENDRILREAIEKLLTADQKKILAEMEGPKFTPDPNERNSFGGGFGGGFGGRGGGGTGGGGGGRGGSTGGGGGF